VKGSLNPSVEGFGVKDGEGLRVEGRGLRLKFRVKGC